MNSRVQIDGDCAPAFIPSTSPDGHSRLRHLLQTGLRHPELGYLLKLALITSFCYVMGLAVRIVPFEQGGAPAVWPPTGCALAALLLFGYRFWPAVFVAELLLARGTGLPFHVLLSVSTGCTLQALAGVYLLRGVGDFRNSLERLQDVLALIILAAGLSTLASAWTSALSILLAGGQEWGAYSSTWWIWRLAHILGDLIVAPVILTWAAQPDRKAHPRRAVEIIGLLAALTVVCLVVFGVAGTSWGLQSPLPYVVFPVLIWAAVRFGLRGAVTATLLVALVGMSCTVNGYGSFAGPSLKESMLLLQAFIAVVAISVLLLAASIGERQQAQDSLGQSEEHYRALFESNPHPMWLYDTETLAFLAVNEAAVEAYGFSKEEFLAMTIKDLRPHERPLSQIGVTRTSTRKEKTGAWRHRRKDGGTLDVEISMHDFPFNGRPARLVLAHDITQRRQAELALRASEERYRQLFEDVPIGMYRTTPDGQTLLANPALVHMLGFQSFEELAARSMEEQVADSSYPRRQFREFLDREGEAHGLENTWRKRDQSMVHVRENARAVRDKDGKVLYYEGTIEDITDRVRAEEAIRINEAKYRTLIENLEQCIFLKDADLNFVAANKPFAESLGCTESDIIGKSDFDFYPANLADKYRADDRLILLEGKRLELEEENIAGGKARVVRVVKTPVKDGQGRNTGVLGIFWDVTEQRALETQLRQAQKMEAVGQLAGGVAHDFNNLLTAILGNLSLVLSSLPGDDPNRELLRSAEKASERAANLTRQMLGFSRQTLLQPQPTSLKDVLEEVAALLQRTFDPRIALEIDCPCGAWMVQADPSQMNQVLMNLCLNARDAMPQGGSLLLKTENVVLDEAYPRLHLEARPGEFVRLRVQDTGHGIPQEVRPRIFEPFFTTKEQGKGTGLGLATVFGIVKQHRGWIDCYSEVGRGTRFDIYLPRSCQDGTPAVTTLSSCSSYRGSETILLVDDEAILRSLAKMILEKFGYEVLLAEDGMQAVEVYEQNRATIDLVVLDLTMPRLSGRDAFHLLVEINPQIKVLFASGYSAEHLTEVQTHQLVGFVSKPYRPEELLQMVRAALDRDEAKLQADSLGEPASANGVTMLRIAPN